MAFAKKVGQFGNCFNFVVLGYYRNGAVAGRALVFLGKSQTFDSNM